MSSKTISYEHVAKETTTVALGIAGCGLVSSKILKMNGPSVKSVGDAAKLWIYTGITLLALDMLRMRDYKFYGFLED